MSNFAARIEHGVHSTLFSRSVNSWNLTQNHIQTGYTCIAGFVMVVIFQLELTFQPKFDSLNDEQNPNRALAMMTHEVN